MLNTNKENRKQGQLVYIDDLVPKHHLLRKINKAIDWSFIYELVEDKYCLDNGRPSIDPVTLIKIPMLQYLYGIKSIRQTIKEIGIEREKHNKKPLKDNNNNNDKNSGGTQHRQ